VPRATVSKCLGLNSSGRGWRHTSGDQERYSGRTAGRSRLSFVHLLQSTDLSAGDKLTISGWTLSPLDDRYGFGSSFRRSCRLAGDGTLSDEMLRRLCAGEP
jgi:hypothetical protein